MSTICFTGHRPKALAGYNPKSYEYLRGYLLHYLKGLDADHYISGGAQGFDQIAFWAVQELKKSRPNVINEVVIPFSTQSLRWAPTGLFSQQEWKEMLQAADQIKCLSNTYSKKLLIERNHVMVDKADDVIALYNGDKTSGTAECLRYAYAKNKKIHLISYRVLNSVVMPTGIKIVTSN